MKKFAIVISGCGVQDGTEIHEAVMAMLAVDMAGGTYQLFAPDIEQTRVVNHLTGKPTDEKRNVLVESARIARGNIKPLQSYSPESFDALIFPGGFGAALNLSTFATEGEKMSVNPEVERAVKSTHSAGKPIGAMCIAPVVVAKILGSVNVTIGDDSGVASAICSFGSSHTNAGKGEVVADLENKVFTTPCYMLDSAISDIFEGATKLISRIMQELGN